VQGINRLEFSLSSLYVDVVIKNVFAVSAAAEKTFDIAETDSGKNSLFFSSATEPITV
jgi:hypothetical protein